MAIRIYTKTGDKGKTALIGGVKVSKSNIRIESYGTLDELSSHIGLVRDLIDDELCLQILEVVQNELFVIGSLLACAPNKEPLMNLPSLEEDSIENIEKEIDRMESYLPVMKNFILPGGNVAVSNIHIARCVCRRAERLCVALVEQGEPVPKLGVKYLNRLSDYLFVLARYIGGLLNVNESVWAPPRR